MKRISFAAVFFTVLSSLSLAQDKQVAPSAASLIEQAKFAEEQRDFVKAQDLFTAAMKAAMAAQDPELAKQASEALGRVKLRAVGIGEAPLSDEDPMICRLAERMFSLWSFGENTQGLEDAYNDIALFGAIAVPWLEKAIQGPYRLCDYEIRSDPPVLVRALALMTA
ncbi:MAG: hypothetical protein ABI054_01215, partial [Planctomycetota bacterium]